MTKKELILGTLPLWNYVATVVAETEQAAKRALRKSYLKYKKEAPGRLPMSFEEYWEYAGGSLLAMPLEQVEFL